MQMTKHVNDNVSTMIKVEVLCIRALNIVLYLMGTFKLNKFLPQQCTTVSDIHNTNTKKFSYPTLNLVQELVIQTPGKKSVKLVPSIFFPGILCFLKTAGNVVTL